MNRKLRRSDGKWMKVLMLRYTLKSIAQHEAVLSEILECAYVDPDDVERSSGGGHENT
jgi:hypothetical protein